MRLFVVRHAHAGDRSRWVGDDRLRPLSDRGHRQAEVIAAALADRGVTRLLSSPYIRCIETFGPLAKQSGVPVDSEPRLAEGAQHVVASLMDELLARGETAAVCSHGDIIPAILEQLVAAEVDFHHDLTWPKASTWVITAGDGGWATADYVPPPDA